MARNVCFLLYLKIKKMLKNVSYNDPKVEADIRKEVGVPFTILKRIELGGIGSPKLEITACSKEINNLLILDNNTNTCNIELRPKGIIVRFRSLLETYALVIPYYKLVLFKGKSNEYAIYKDHFVLKIKIDNRNILSFFKKIMKQKSVFLTFG